MALEHQELPSAWLVAALRARGRAATALFDQVHVVWRDPFDLRIGELATGSFPVPWQVVRRDLTFRFEVSDGELHGLLQHRTATVPAEQAARIRADCARTLVGAVTEPDRRLVMFTPR